MANILGAIGGGFKGVINIIGMIPSIISVVETIVKAIKGVTTKGSDKKAMAVALVREAILAAEGFSNKDIIDEEAFAAGLDKVIDGTVSMLNASIWHKSV